MDQKGSRLHIPDCPVCWSTFNDAGNAPLVLQCGHTLCKACIEQLVMIGNEAGRYALQCPECRYWCLWAGSLPKNFMLLRALSYAAPEEPPQQWHGPAGNVPESTALVSYRRNSSVSVKSWISKIVEEKVWGIVRLMRTVVLFLCFLPLSFTHMIFWWWTAILGGIVFCWFSIGGLGMGVFFTFVTGTTHICRLLRLHIARHLFGDPVEPHAFIRNPRYNRPQQVY